MNFYEKQHEALMLTLRLAASIAKSTYYEGDQDLRIAEVTAESVMVRIKQMLSLFTKAV